MKLEIEVKITYAHMYKMLLEELEPLNKDLKFIKAVPILSENGSLDAITVVAYFDEK